MTKTLLIKNAEIAKDLSIAAPSFPKYTTQLINLANQNAGGTRPKVVGQLSELTQEFSGASVEEWSEWYAKKMPGAIETATSRVFQMIHQLQSAVLLIDEGMVRKWVTDLVINKTFAGMKFQGAILRHLAVLRGQSWKLATPDEEAQGIDGFIGGSPVSVKPTTYKSKQMLPEEIAVEMVYYEKAKDGIKVTIKL